MSKPLSRKFIAVAGAAFLALGAGGELYANNQQGSLAADYARAAQCEKKQQFNDECTEAERASLAKKQANESNRDMAEWMIIGGAIAVLQVLP